MNLFAMLEPAQVQTTPFPHVVVEQALPVEQCRELVAGFPPWQELAGTADLPSAQKFLSRDRSHVRMGAALERLLEAHLQPEAWLALVRLFAPCIRASYPELERLNGPLESLAVGRRQVDSPERCPILLDAQLSFLAPVKGNQPQGERGPHVKGSNKLIEAQLFLRDPQDDTAGGEFEFYQALPGHRPRFGPRHQTALRGLRCTRSIHYRSGTLVVWVNRIEAITRIAPRSPSRWPVQIVSLPVQWPEPLFALPQESPGWWQRWTTGWNRQAG